jgi:hypothetical protein
MCDFYSVRLVIVDGSEVVAGEFPYPTNPDDHCETPLEAYRDIAPLLRELERLLDVDRGAHTADKSRLSASVQLDSSQLRIYDPYYCNGAVKDHFLQLGFPLVHNEKEDCYGVWSAKATKETSHTYPSFDVLVTNPPYSDDHIEKLVSHVSSISSDSDSKSWFLLLPTWVRSVCVRLGHMTIAIRSDLLLHCLGCGFLASGS